MPGMTGMEAARKLPHEGTPADTSLIIESIWPGYDVKKAKFVYLPVLLAEKFAGA